MLRRLQISNYALIEEAELEFGNGFTVLTGETGSGKSIMLGALSLLLGNRADSRVAAGGKARVLAQFDDVDSELRPLLESKGIDWIQSDNGDGGEITIRREVSAEGRSRTFVNDTTVTLATLSDIAGRLVDIHSQMANSKLSNPDEQLKIVDAYSGNSSELNLYRESFREFVGYKRKIKNIRQRMEKNRENEEFLRFQLEQLDRLKPRKGELAEIEKRYEILSDADEIRERLGRLLGLMGDADHGIQGDMSEALGMVGKLDFSLFGNVGADADIPARMEAIQTELRDITSTFEEMSGMISTDPATLARLSDRMQNYYETVKRFHVGDADELVGLQSDLRRELNEINGGGEELPELERRARACGAELKRRAEALSETRRQGAKALADKILQEARGLGLANLKFEIAVDNVKLNPDGQDHAVFMGSFNKNGELRPISEIASGGEMSRLMLSLKAVVAERINMPTVIFDEVDTGVSGEIADRMGRMMNRMGERMQVLAITHLPQVAARGNDHFKVYKQDESDRTVTHIGKLDDLQRVAEIAAMISGSHVSEAALSNARALLGGDN
ncbi:MAG: DNA repair protein RecN [Bacteroidales bacterium]|nr:DNA repair protein RecN [Bacteroidales bacterium]